jgi:phage baseplate assembly protein W
MCRKEIRRWGCQKSELIDEAVNSIIKSKIDSEDA